MVDYKDIEEQEIENEVLTPQEVMFYLCIGKNTFYKLVKEYEQKKQG